jgi:hypothetical protein
MLEEGAGGRTVSDDTSTGAAGERHRDPRLERLVAAISPGEDSNLSIEAMLAVWAVSNPSQGSFAKMCAKASLEIATLRRRANSERARAEQLAIVLAANFPERTVDGWMSMAAEAAKAAEEDA